MKQFFLVFTFLVSACFAAPPPKTVKPPELGAILNSELASGDLFLVWDTSASITKKFTLLELEKRFLAKTGTAASAETLSATLPVNKGGTGQTTASAAINALLPSQEGNTGKFLTTNGTVTSWGVSSGGIGGSVGTTDNAIPRANGTGETTLQGSGVLINDDNQVVGPTGATYPAFTFAGQTSSGLAWNSVFGTVEILVGGTRYMDAGNNVVAWTKNFTADAGTESIGRDASNVYGFNQAYVKTLFLGVPNGNVALTGEDGLIVAKELSAKPATNPPTGFWGLYFKSDGLYMVDDAGTETKISP